MYSPAHERPIAVQLTAASSDHPTTPDDPLAGQRVELLGRLVAAQFDLESLLAELSRSGATTAVADAATQLEALGRLQRQIGAASPAALAAMRAEITATVAASQMIAQQGRAAAAAADADGLEATTARTHATVQRIAGDLFERRIFDPYLQFGSAEEEEAYRRREADRREYIEQELARGTPQGNLNAADATVAQVKDAGAHGAERSPEYQTVLRDVTQARNEQAAAMQPEGNRSRQPEGTAPHGPPAADTDLEAIAATIRAAGVTSHPADSAGQDGHGLTNTGIDRGGNAVGC